jgi:hypothetical protein
MYASMYVLMYVCTYVGECVCVRVCVRVCARAYPELEAMQSSRAVVFPDEEVHLHTAVSALGVVHHIYFLRHLEFAAIDVVLCFKPE